MHCSGDNFRFLSLTTQGGVLSLLDLCVSVMSVLVLLECSPGIFGRVGLPVDINFLRRLVVYFLWYAHLVLLTLLQMVPV